ncbi:MAG: D-glycerate dehydrogenase [Dehalococcoidia bacterium]
MAKPRVFVALRWPVEALARIDAECEMQRYEGPGGQAPKEALIAALGDVEGLMGSAQLPVDAEVLAAAPRLRVVSNFGVGFDNIDVAAATDQGILVCNTPGVLTDAVADLTLGLVIDLARKVVEAERIVREGNWAAGRGIMGNDLRGKTLGIVGFGRIGRAVAQRARAFGMQMRFHDVFDDPGADFADCAYRSLDDLLREADFVTLHVNLTDETEKLIGARELALMKPAAYLINTARGPVVDQTALTEALREGRIAGVALDVLEREPPADDDPILSLPNAVILPHIGSATRETRQAMLDLAIDNLLTALRGETPKAVVNPEVLAARK